MPIIEENNWLVRVQNQILTTQGKYLDRNIKFSLADAAANVTGSATASKPTLATASASLSNKTQLTTTVSTATTGIDTYYLALKPSIGSFNVTLTPSVTTTGYLGRADQINVLSGASVTGADGDIYYLPIATGIYSVTAVGNKDLLSFKPTLSSKTDGNITASAFSTTKPSSGYYLAIGSNAGSTQSATVTANITTAGWIPTGSKSKGISGELNASDTYYASIAAATTTNITASIADTAVPIISTEGYIPATKITALNIPEGTDSNRYRLDITKHNYTRVYITGDADTESRVYVRDNTKTVYIGDNANKTLNSLSIANSTKGYTVTGASLGYSSVNTVEAQAKIGTFTLQGKNTSAAYPDQITILKVGSSATAANAKINTIDNYGTITNINQKAGASLKVTLEAGSSMQINDGIYTWTIARDSSGNVTFT